MNETQETTSHTIEWLAGGGGLGLSSLGYLIYDKFLKPKFDNFEKRITKLKEKQAIIFASLADFDNYIKDDRQTFIEFSKEYADFKGHTEEAIERVDKAESRIDDFIVEIKASSSNLIERFSDIKTGVNIQEGRIADLEKSERKHYEELKDMSSDNRIMDKEIAYLRSDMSDIKESLRQLTIVVTDMKEQLIKLASNK